MMRRLSDFGLLIICSLLISGTSIITINNIPIISIYIGCFFIITALAKIYIECGPRVWYWWVPFRLGCDVTLTTTEHKINADDINLWLEDNINFKIGYTNFGNTYYFLFGADAAGFKLRWL